MPSSYLEQFIKINVGSYLIPLILVFIFSNSFFLMTLEIFRWALYPMTYSLLSLASVFLGSFLSFGFITLFDISVLGFHFGSSVIANIAPVDWIFNPFSRFTLVIKRCRETQGYALKLFHLHIYFLDSFLFFLII